MRRAIHSALTDSKLPAFRLAFSAGWAYTLRQVEGSGVAILCQRRLRPAQVYIISFSGPAAFFVWSKYAMQKRSIAHL